VSQFADEGLLDKKSSSAVSIVEDDDMDYFKSLAED
jgi:hypothetical protein